MTSKNINKYLEQGADVIVGLLTAVKMGNKTLIDMFLTKGIPLIEILRSIILINNPIYLDGLLKIIYLELPFLLEQLIKSGVSAPMGRYLS